MGIEKSEIKMGTANEIGADLDDILERFQKSEYALEGADRALAQVGKNIEDLMEHVDLDMNEGKLDIQEPMHVAKAIKDYIKKSIGVVTSLVEANRANRIRTQGKIEATKAAISTVKKLYDAEKAKAHQMLKVLERAKDDGGDLVYDGGEEGDPNRPPSRPTGVHPSETGATSDLDQRRAEARAERDQTAIEGNDAKDTGQAPRPS